MKLLCATVVVFCSIAITFSKHYHLGSAWRGLSGRGVTTRYWDCCKPSCAWAENLKVRTATPVASCSADGTTIVSPSTKSSCDMGTAYVCSNQQPVMVNASFALGFAAASFTGGVDTNMCCACMLLKFHGAMEGKQMIVQVTNTGSDLTSNHFDIAIPGGGMGIFNRACPTQWGTTTSSWGDQYGGVHSESECSQLPAALQEGCKFRFEFMQGADNPSVSFEQVDCPAELVQITGCNY